MKKYFMIMDKITFKSVRSRFKIIQIKVPQNHKNKNDYLSYVKLYSLFRYFYLKIFIES